MKLSRPNAEIWIPDGTPVQEALRRTTHMGIGAHQDDLEIMCLEGILAGFASTEHWFTGVIVTDGAGSARDAMYANYTGKQMAAVRKQEQKKAAYVGEFAALALLDHTSAAVKDPANRDAAADIAALLDAARPEVVYIHNLADKHATHVAVAMHCIRALRSLPKEHRPRRLYGCEVWRDLDWMQDQDKVMFRLDEHENIAAALIGVFDSQVVGGKRYDLATPGRRRANATYAESHKVDRAQMVNFGMNLTPLVEDDTLDVTAYVLGHVDRFAGAVREAIGKYE